eukprot:g17251.t1
MASSVSCDTGFNVLGLKEDEQKIIPVHHAATLITISLASAWFSLEKVQRLSLFFAHWLSGLVAGLGYLIEGMMIAVCWTDTSLEGFIKAIKFFELAAFNMLAITNLAISVNLALIVVAHRTVSRVKSVSSAPLIFLFLAISVILAVVSIPFWDTIIVLGTVFGVAGADEAGDDFINVSYFWVELFVGVCMFIIVVWLLLFRMEGIKESWNIHRRIRYFFGLTLVGTGVNLGVGICGLVNVLDRNPTLLIWGWLFRYIHIALDTIVLYGALVERNMSERDNGATADAGGAVDGSEHRLQIAREQLGTRPRRQSHVQRGHTAESNSESISLAYLDAATHGLEDAGRLRELLEAQRMPPPETRPGAPPATDPTGAKSPGRRDEGDGLANDAGRGGDLWTAPATSEFIERKSPTPSLLQCIEKSANTTRWTRTASHRPYSPPGAESVELRNVTGEVPK